MSILINREMPKGCWECPFAVGKHYECLFTKKSYNWGLTTRPSDCPLIEVKSPHGRLIDADALIKELKECMYVANNNWEYEMVTGYSNAIESVEEACTIIEAEGDDNG